MNYIYIFCLLVLFMFLVRIFVPFLIWLLPVFLVYFIIKSLFKRRKTKKEETYQQQDYQSYSQYNNDIIDVDYTVREDDTNNS